MSEATLREALDELLQNNVTAITKYTEEQTMNSDLPSLLEITDLDNVMVNLPKLADDILALFDFQLDKLMEQKTEYLDCKESPEMGWQDCICPNIEVVSIESIEALKSEIGGK